MLQSARRDLPRIKLAVDVTNQSKLYEKVINLDNLKTRSPIVINEYIFDGNHMIYTEGNIPYSTYMDNDSIDNGLNVK